MNEIIRGRQHRGLSALVKATVFALVFTLLGGCAATTARYRDRDRIGDFISNVAAADSVAAAQRSNRERA